MPCDIRGKLVLITGASSGIGAACAEAFAQHGCRLILTARRLERLEALQQKLVGDHSVRLLWGRTVDAIIDAIILYYMSR
jgi:short-subunit dehydrogenase